MKECELCSDEHNRRSPYCSTACKQADWRRRQSVTDNESVTAQSVTPVTVAPKCNMIETPEGLKPEVPANYGLANCECQQCQGPAVKSGQLKLNHGPYKKADELQEGEMNRVNLPGDVDYEAHVMDAQEVE